MGATAMSILFTKEQIDLVTEVVGSRLNIVDDRKDQNAKFNSIASNIEVLQQDTKQLQQDTRDVKSELKHQRELMIQGFKNTDKRFEQMQHNFDKRFEENQHHFNKRFDQSREDFKSMFNFMKWQTGLGFAMVMGIYIKLYVG